jgi:predicted DNA-binding protein
VLAMSNLENAKPKSVRLPDDLSTRIELAAQREQRTFSGQVRSLVTKALEAQQPAQGEAA